MMTAQQFGALSDAEQAAAAARMTPRQLAALFVELYKLNGGQLSGLRCSCIESELVGVPGVGWSGEWSNDTGGGGGRGGMGSWFSRAFRSVNRAIGPVAGVVAPIVGGMIGGPAGAAAAAAVGAAGGGVEASVSVPGYGGGSIQLGPGGIRLSPIGPQQNTTTPPPSRAATRPGCDTDARCDYCVARRRPEACFAECERRIRVGQAPGGSASERQAGAAWRSRLCAAGGGGGGGGSTAGRRGGAGVVLALAALGLALGAFKL